MLTDTFVVDCKSFTTCLCKFSCKYNKMNMRHESIYSSESYNLIKLLRKKIRFWKLTSCQSFTLFIISSLLISGWCVQIFHIMVSNSSNRICKSCESNGNRLLQQSHRWADCKQYWTYGKSRCQQYAPLTLHNSFSEVTIYAERFKNNFTNFWGRFLNPNKKKSI